MPYSNKQIQRLLDPDLIPADRVPHKAMRVAETVLKRSLFALEERAVRQQWQLYKAAHNDIKQHAEMLGRRGFIAREFRIELRQYINQRIERLRVQVAAVALRASVAAANGGYYGRAWLLDVATRDDVIINVPAFDPTRFVMRESFEGDAYEQIVISLLGRSWAEQFDEVFAGLTPQIATAIITGMEAGEDIPTLMDRVARVMGVNIDPTQGYRANFNQVSTITRTLANQLSNDAGVVIYRNNADILTGKEWITARDERVCPVCRPLDGTVTFLDSNDRPPAHPNCRCTEVPVIDPQWLEDGTADPRNTLLEWAVAFGVGFALQDYISSSRLERERYG